MLSRDGVRLFPRLPGMGRIPFLETRQAEREPLDMDKSFFDCSKTSPYFNIISVLVVNIESPHCIIDLF